MPVTRKIFIDRADRLQRMPVATALDLEHIAARMTRRGVEVIDLSRATAPGPAASLPFKVAENADDWRPAGDELLRELAGAVCAWYDHRFGVRLDPEHEVVVVPNSVMGLSLLALAFVDSGNMVLLPDPGLPFYRGAVALCGGGVMPYHLWERNDYLPSFPGLESGLVGRTRMMVMSYPNNPTAAVADLNVLTQAVSFGRRQGVFMVFDAAFTHAFHGPVRPRGFMEATGARSVGVEIFPLGTSFGIDDLPLAVLVGNRDALSAISFLTQASRLRPLSRTVRLAIAVLNNAEPLMQRRMEQLALSRGILVEALTQVGWMPRAAPTVPFLWVSVPGMAGSEGFGRRLLRRTGLRVTPGSVFGVRGEGFVRVAIPADEAAAKVVAERLHSHARLYQRRIPRRNPLRRRKRTEPAEGKSTD